MWLYKDWMAWVVQGIEGGREEVNEEEGGKQSM